MKKTRLLWAIVVGIIGGIIVLIGLIYFILFMISFVFPTPPKPEIKYTEIDFTLKYEICGEEFKYSDSLVCKFDGYDLDLGRGKSRRWREYYKSNPQKDMIILYRINDTHAITLGVGTTEYFMSEPDVENYPNNPYISVFNFKTGYYLSGTDEEKKYCKIVDLRCWIGIVSHL